jgi:outer membrane protein
MPRKTLDLVTKTYREGLATILDVIDAQNVTLRADELVADTEDNFLIDLMNSQRATNRFNFLLPEEERKGDVQRFEEFLSGR